MATANQNAQGLVLALFNASAGGNLANLAPLASTASAANALGGNLVAVAALVTGKNLSDNTTFRDTLLANLQITSTNAAYANAKAWVDGQLATPGTDKGSIAGTAVTYLLSLTDATNPYYAAASKFQARNDAAVTWSTSAAGSAVLSATSLIAQQATVDNYVAPPPPPVGVTTVALTAGVDAIVGGTGADAITGGANSLASIDTLQATDTIDGGAGADTLTLTISKDFSGFTIGSGYLKNVETVNITNTTTNTPTFTARGVSDVTTYNLTGVVNLAGVITTTPTINFGGTTGTKSISVGYDGAAIAGTADSATYGFSGLGTADDVTTTADDPQYVTVTAAGIEKITINATGANYAAIGGSDDVTLIATGSGSLRLDAISSATKTIDASAVVGAVDLKLANATGITSVKTGSGNDVIRVLNDDVTGNAVIDGGTGANTLRMATSQTTTVAYAMANIQTVRLDSVANTLNFSGSASTGITDIYLSKEAGAVTTSFSDMGSAPLTITVESSGSTDPTNAATLSVDTTGAVTANWTAGSSTSSKSSNDLVTATNASTATFTIGKYTAITGNLTASKATSVTLSGDGKYSTGTLTAPAMTSLTINQSFLGVTDELVAVSYGTGSASLLNSLDLTIKGGLLVTSAGTNNTEKFTALQTLKVNTDVAWTNATNAGLTSDDTGALNSITLSGGADASAVTLVNVGGTSLTYPVSLTATGLKAGLTIADLDTGSGQAITVDISGVRGSTSIASGQTISAGSGSTGGVITINANGFGDSVGGTADTLTLGAITGKSVSVDANGVPGALTVGVLTGNDVTFKATTAGGSVQVGDGAANGTADVVAKNSLVFYGANLAASNDDISIASGSTAFTADVKGGIVGDTLNFVSASTTQTSITITGALGAGTNALNVTSSVCTTSAGQTIDISGVTGVSTSTLIGSTKADTIKGSSGVDTITGGVGADILYGNGGNDVFVLRNTTETGAITASGLLTKVSDNSSASFTTSTTLVSGDKITTSTFDKIMDFNAGDEIVTNGQSTQGTVSAIAIGSSISTSKDSFISGTYSASANTFTFSASGTDTLYVFQDATTSTTYDAIVLVGYTQSATAQTTGTTGIVGSA